VVNSRIFAVNRASGVPKRFPRKNPIVRIGNVAQVILQPRTPSFWPLQLGGWTLCGLATAVSYIPFRHMREQVDYRIAFLFSTFLASFLFACLLSVPMAPVYRTIFCFVSIRRVVLRAGRTMHLGIGRCSPPFRR